MPDYVELHAASAFSFLRGASLLETLVAVALCDRMGVYGSPRFRRAMREQGLRALTEAEPALTDGSVLPVQGALNAFAAHRRAALWETGNPLRQDELFRDEPSAASSPLRPMDALERLQADYAGQRLTTGPHPMALVRAQLPDL